MIVPVIAILNLVLTQQIYSQETNGAHAHYREPVPLNLFIPRLILNILCLLPNSTKVKNFNLNLILR